MRDSATQRRVQLAVQALIAFVALVVLRPFLLPAAWAAILAFAMLGLFIGPVALALVLALWREWSRESAAR